MSTPIDTLDRYADFSIDTYCLDQYVQKKLYNRVLSVFKIGV